MGVEKLKMLPLLFKDEFTKNNYAEEEHSLSCWRMQTNLRRSSNWLPYLRDYISLFFLHLLCPGNLLHPVLGYHLPWVSHWAAVRKKYTVDGPKHYIIILILEDPHVNYRKTVRFSKHLLRSGASKRITGWTFSFPLTGWRHRMLLGDIFKGDTA